MDAPPGPAGLQIDWSSSPTSWPSSYYDGIKLEKARIALNRLRVVGDAGPGDPRTTASNIELGWAWDNDGQLPSDIEFDNAPTGLYSQVAIAIDPSGNPTLRSNAYELRGHVLLGGEDWEFRIEDRNPLAFNVAIEEMVSPGSGAVVKLHVNFLQALDAMDFTDFNTQDGRLELDEGDPEIVQFRQFLVQSFEIVSSGSSGSGG